MAFLRSGIVAATIANVYRGKNQAAYSPSDFMPSSFMPSPKTAGKAQTVEEMGLAIEAIVRSAERAEKKALKMGKEPAVRVIRKKKDG